MATKKVVGRPPKYKSKEEIEEKIEEYFKECEGEILKDDEGKPIFNKFGSPVVINQRPPSHRTSFSPWIFYEAVTIELSREKGVYEHDNTCEGKGGSVCRRTAL